jgi:hypothetical protein
MVNHLMIRLEHQNRQGIDRGGVSSYFFYVKKCLPDLGVWLENDTQLKKEHGDPPFSCVIFEADTCLMFVLVFGEIDNSFNIFFVALSSKIMVFCNRNIVFQPGILPTAMCSHANFHNILIVNR